MILNFSQQIFRH
jgi:hypothetical protein